MAAYVELYLDQGATFRNVINITDDLTNAALNISGYSISSKMKRSHYSVNTSANIICTITNAANGEITMILDSANTANLVDGRYVFDVMAINPQNTTTKILEGIITVNPTVTI